MKRPPPRSTLFPSTTLFRSRPALAVPLRALFDRRLGVPNFLEADKAPPPRPRPGRADRKPSSRTPRSEEHTSELQSRQYLVCRLLLEKKKNLIHAIILLFCP